MVLGDHQLLAGLGILLSLVHHGPPSALEFRDHLFFQEVLGDLSVRVPW